MNRKIHVAMALVGLSAFCTPAGDALSETAAGRVLSVRRKVEVIREKVRKSALPQMELLLQDSVETDRQSRTKLLFSDDSILNLGEMSRVVVEEYIYSPEKQRSRSIYRLVDGALKVVVGRSDLEIHTPTAVAAARGTTIVIWKEGVGDDLRTCAFSESGTFSLRNKEVGIGGEVIVDKGTMSCVPLDGPPEPVFAVSSRAKSVLRDIAALGSIAGELGAGLPDRFSAEALVERSKALARDLKVLTGTTAQSVGQEPQAGPTPQPPPPPPPPESPPPRPTPDRGPPTPTGPDPDTPVTIRLDFGG